ncbi:MAG: redoxin domain-containing protein, partial [Chitinophagaceae bacterium]|nr:redoxin domain-containing protein [Chitinophagaceae bacterium]
MSFENIRKGIVLLLLGNFFVVCIVNAQTKSITVGDKCPDVPMKLINYQQPELKISDFKGKIVILDFWATWCKPCVESFVKIDSLNKIYADKVQIMPVAYEDVKKVKPILDKLESVFNVKSPSVVNDIELQKIFPHTIVPHCVWIDRGG